MDEAKLMTAGIDMHLGIERFSGDAQAYEKALKSYLKDDNFDMLKHALERGDSEAAVSAVRALKAFGASLAMTELYSASKQLHERLRSRASLNECVASFKAVESAHDKIVATIK